jgi:RNA recognition motif-containing protein
VQLNDYAALRMRGLPFSSKPEDIITFFKDYDAYHDSVKIGKNSDNTKTGEAAILFKDENEAKRAFQQKQG